MNEHRDDHPSLTGLDEAEERASAEQFFAALPWEPVQLDPKALSAERFLDLL